MEIYNKGHRDIIVALADVTLPKDAVVPANEKRYHIRPEAVVEVKDSVAAELIRRYPKEIFQWGKKKE